MSTLVDHIDLDVQDCIEQLDTLVGDVAKDEDHVLALEEVDEEWWEKFRSALSESRDLLVTAHNALTKARENA